MYTLLLSIRNSQDNAKAANGNTISMAVPEWRQKTLMKSKILSLVQSIFTSVQLMAT